MAVKTSLIAFDIDDTLFKPESKIKVMKDGKVVKELTSAESHNYVLQEGETTDVSEFESAQYFYDTARPINATIDLFRQYQKDPADEIILITGRGKIDDKTKFIAAFLKHGINMNGIKIECVGGGNNLAIAANKERTLKRYLSATLYERAVLYEDSRLNLRHFLHLASTFAHTIFDAFLVLPSGVIQKYLDV